MEIRNNIIISIMIHVMAIALVAIIGSRVRDMEFRVPDHMTVSLFEEETVIPSVAVTSVIVKDKVLQISQLQETRLIIPRDVIASPSVRDDIPQYASDKHHQTVTQGTSQVFIMQDKGTSGENPLSQNTTTSYIASKPLPDRNSFSSQYSLIRAAIEKAKIYPYIARKKKFEGTVITEFSINNKGYPQDITVRKSSGSEILDSAATSIIKKAAPFPLIDRHVVIPITFSLRDVQFSE